MTMKRLTIMTAVAALMLGASQCRKPVDTIATPQGGTVEVTVSVTNGADKTDITSAGIVEWKKGDRLYVVGETKGLLGHVTATAAGDPVNFTGEIIAFNEAQTLRFYYVGDNGFKLDGNNYTLSTSVQDGSLTDIATKNQLMWGIRENATLPDLGTITMRSCIAIAHLNINYGGNAVSDPVTITGGYKGATFNAKTFDGTFSSTTSGDITMTFAGATSTNCYLALLPGTQTLKFIVSSKVNTLGEKTVKANKFYNADNAIAVTVEHEYVNFGTPNLNWSKYNLGIDILDLDTDTDWYGNYYQWGSATPVTSTANVGWANCPHTRGTYSSGNKKVFTKYVPKNKASTYGYGGYYDDLTTLQSADDAAAVAWGNGWRMPTQQEWESLCDNNTFRWLAKGTTDSGTGFKAVAAGYLVVKGGKNGISLNNSVYMFLPAAGYREGTSLGEGGSGGCYWSSSLNTDTPDNANAVYFTSGSITIPSIDHRYYGYSVRPVR